MCDHATHIEFSSKATLAQQPRRAPRVARPRRTVPTMAPKQQVLKTLAAAYSERTDPSSISCVLCSPEEPSAARFSSWIELGHHLRWQHGKKKSDLQGTYLGGQT